MSDNDSTSIRNLKDGSQVEFFMEIDVISNVRDLNPVKLIGCCVEGNNRLLLYEYAENNGLTNALIGKFYSEILLARTLTCLLTIIIQLN